MSSRKGTNRFLQSIMVQGMHKGIQYCIQQNKISSRSRFQTSKKGQGSVITRGEQYEGSIKIRTVKQSHFRRSPIESVFCTTSMHLDKPSSHFQDLQQCRRIGCCQLGNNIFVCKS